MGQYLKKDNLIVDLQKREIRKGKRPIVLRVNEGFLCTDTWQQLHTFSSKKDAAGAQSFAKHILEAGLHISSSTVVTLFEKMR